VSLRFFADHCVPNYVIRALENEGHDVFRLRDFLPTDAPDLTVISKAQELGCILISLDGDFANIIMFPPSEFMGIVALQLRNRPEVLPRLVERLMDYILAHPEMGHYHGLFLLVEPDRIRIRT